MNGFFLFTGEQGSGKSVMAVHDVFTERKKRKVFSNATLYGIEFEPITFDATKPANIGKMDILKALEKNPHVFDNSVMFIDEIHLYLDSRDFMRKNQRPLETFFSQLRKRHILLLGTAQSMWNVDIRCRRQCMNTLHMDHVKGGVFTVETYKLANNAYDEIFVSKYAINLKEYFSKYDTDEVQE